MTFVIDIDDTLLYSKVEENGDYKLTGANFPLIKKINQLFGDGNKIILWTGRHWNHLLLTQGELSAAGIKYTTLIMGKPVADYYIDDRALRPDEFEKII